MQVTHMASDPLRSSVQGETLDRERGLRRESEAMLAAEIMELKESGGYSAKCRELRRWLEEAECYGILPDALLAFAPAKKKLMEALHPDKYSKATDIVKGQAEHLFKQVSATNTSRSSGADKS